MKKMLLMMIVAGITFGCSPDVASIKGIYVSSWSTSFGVSMDTLLIAPIADDNDEDVLLTRKTFTLYKDSVRGADNKVVHWTGRYDGDTKVVTVANNGRLLYFSGDGLTMKMGTAEYVKL